MKLDLTGASIDNKKTYTIPIDYKGGTIALFTTQGGYFHTSMSSPNLTHNGVKLEYGKDYRYMDRSLSIWDRFGVVAHSGILLLKRGLVGQLSITAGFVGDVYRQCRTDYINDITATEYLETLYNSETIINIPEKLPPRVMLLDMESIKTGLLSGTQLILNFGNHLQDQEVGLPLPPYGDKWPNISRNPT